jgi:Secretion system C-terminal sorting domain
MKYIIIYISLLFILPERQVNAQCIPNHEFGENCGTTINKDNNPTFADNCVPGWIPSHGTPQYFWHNFGQSTSYTPANRPLWHIMYMWANGDDGRSRGEGIYAPYAFKQGNTYKVSFRYSCNWQYLGRPSDATIQLKAAQNISRPSKWKWGNLQPATTRQQDILTFAPNMYNTWLATAIITFIPDNDYNQFWIFPHSTSNNNQFNLYVDWVSVCRDDCASNSYYRTGVIPAGEPKSANIFVGSSYGGTGTVTTSPTASTTLIAANEIVFKPAFSATVTSGSFTAKLETCNTTPPTPNRPGETQDTTMLGVPSEVIPFEPGGSYSDEYYESMARGAKPAPVAKSTETVQSQVEKSLSVYPNPSRGVINITGGTGQFTNCTISVTDLTGKQVYRKRHSLASKNALDLSHLKSGVYYIQIRAASKMLSQKLVIVK